MDTIEEDADRSFGSAAQKMKEGAVEIKNVVFEQGAESIDKYCKATEDVIKSNPYRSVLVAFGVGAALGLLLSRR